MEINLIENTSFPEISPVRENMNIFIPNIIEGIPNRNGAIWILSGSGGSGKTSLLLNFFKNKELYRGKFDNIFYICPESSFSSVKDHPFKEHDKVYHELTPEFLTMLYKTLERDKVTVIENIKKKKDRSSLNKGKTHKKPVNFFIDDNPFDDENDDDEDIKDEDCKIKYNCVIIDDMADQLKTNEIVKALYALLIKARHLNTMFIFTLQSYFFLEKTIRKQITNLTLFEPKNVDEWYSVSKELFNLKPNDALDLYNYVFDKQYNHIDLDKFSNTYYKNFDKLEFKKASSSKLKKNS
jgi:hypothetical protein